ncbi:hypothetical protein SAMN05216228_1010161 [Rhizobium tibeticum]|uniref:Uncharacterized protein n=1 Tax=Rhizobium tibeticum TaxID=501024 RepID=A0A1H8L9Q3_9HYPH|nr:hypothetical protein RTCCBAU85039_2802 [Rhizobium tibeticum]SEO01448.1 hypothetical protein SAMN05216228_1010161 [Rhizobium tibeticum]
MYQACCAARVRPLAGMELRGRGAKSTLRARSSLTRMHYQTHSHRFSSLPFADLLTRRRSVLTLAQHLLRCRQNGILVIFVLGHHCPDGSSHFVGERDRDEHARFARQHPCQPRVLGWGFPACPSNDVIAPMIRSRRMSRCPIFDVRPRTCFPPLECCFGTKPSQAAKSRPLRKVTMVGAKASTAIAVIGPMPGMDMRRAVLCERFAADLSAFSSDAIREESASIWSRYSRAVSTTISSRPVSWSSIISASKARFAMP